MNDPAAWEQEESLIDHLGAELNKGRLALFLGAGISDFYDLPDWLTLVNRVCDKLGEAPAEKGDDLPLKIGAIRQKHFKTDPSSFLKVVTGCLYQGLAINFPTILGNRTLAAIGSLIMSSRRGKAAAVVTLNFDDLLEIFLEFHGVIVRSIFEQQHWAGAEDISIYHPHGFLPLSDEHTPSDDIIFDITSYMKIVSTEISNPWRPLLWTLLRSHTFLYIGLSGSDKHLQSLLAPLSDNHAIAKSRLAFHGVRFHAPSTKPLDDTTTVMRGWGVFTHVLPTYDDMPDFLFKVSQAARRLRIRQDNAT